MHQKRALQLIELIYDAVVEPDAWHEFLALLSEMLDGAAIQLSLRLPGRLPTPDNFFRVGLDEGYQAIFVKHAVEGLPWSDARPEDIRGRFSHGELLVDPGTVADRAFYHEYMQPQGLAPEPPVFHVIETEGGRPLAGIVIYRREGRSPIEEDDLAMLDSLVPHLARAYALYCVLRSEEHERRALTEVIDRMPTGVILVDADAKVILMNRSAEKVLAAEDGIRLWEGRPAASDSRENRKLQALLRSAAATDPQAGNAAGAVLCFSRPSGKRPLTGMVGPLMAAAPDMATDEARALLFIADPEDGYSSASEVLEGLYELTHAEADLVRLISEGRSLEEVAELRGVRMNTVRSQLKQVFAKTDTNRQGELVHLVLSGVAALLESTEQGD